MGRDFSVLSRPEKVQAVLSFSPSPIPTRKFVLELAGLDDDSLTKGETNQIDDIFLKARMESREGFMGYGFNGETKVAIVNQLNVEPSSVIWQIADVMLKIWKEGNQSGGVERGKT